jgi:hypothetical protein
MPYGDVAESARALDAQYGANSSSVMPTTNELALFMGGPPAPFGTGTEADYGSYARATVNNADWPDADTATAVKTLTVDWPDSTAAATDDVDTVVMYAPDGTTVVIYLALDEAIPVDDATTGISVDVTLYNPNDDNVVD